MPSSTAVLFGLRIAVGVDEMGGVAVPDEGVRVGNGVSVDSSTMGVLDGGGI